MNIFPHFYLSDLPEDFALIRSSLRKAVLRPSTKTNLTNETNFIINRKINNLTFVKAVLYVFGRYETCSRFLAFFFVEITFLKKFSFYVFGDICKIIIKYSTVCYSLFCAIQCAAYDFQTSFLCE